MAVTVILNFENREILLTDGVHSVLYFTHLPTSPRWTDQHQIGYWPYWGSGRGRYHPCNFF